MAREATIDALSREKQAALKCICRLFVFITVVSGMLLSPFMYGLAKATHDSTPIAVIDGTLSVYAGQTVYLDGSFSTDPGGGSLLYLWTLEEQPEDSIATIADSTDTQASFIADVPGTYRVRLVVNNGFVTSEPAYATIIATP